MANEANLANVADEIKLHILSFVEQFEDSRDSLHALHSLQFTCKSLHRVSEEPLYKLDERRVKDGDINVDESAIDWAVEHNKHETLQLVIRHTPTVLKPRHVTLAIEAGHYEMAHAILRVESIRNELSENREPDGPVFAAIIVGHTSLVHHIIEIQGMDHSLVYANTSLTALHFACLNGHVGLISRLLNDGADPAHFSEIGEPTPLSMAIRCVKRNKASKVLNMIIDAQAPHGFTMPMKECFSLAVATARPELYRPFLEKGVIPPEGEVFSFRSCLNYLIMESDSRVIKKFLDEYAHRFFTKLVFLNGLYAVSLGQDLVTAQGVSIRSVQIAMVLASQGIPASAADLALPLEAAIENNNIPLCKYYYNIIETPGEIPDLRVDNVPSVGMLRLLLRQGFDVDRQRTTWGRSLLCATARRFLPHPSYVELLETMIDASSDVNAQDPDNGETSLHMVSGHIYEYDEVDRQAGHARAEECFLRVVNCLLMKGADPSLPDHRGRTPVHNAAKCAYTSILHLLLRFNPDLQAKDRIGQTPLHCATLGNSRHVPGRNAGEKIRWLILCGANPDAVNDDGRFALHIPLHAHRILPGETTSDIIADVIQAYQESKVAQGEPAPVDVGPLMRRVDHSGGLALSNCVRSNGGFSIGIVDQLLRAGADINQHNDFHESALLMALNHGHFLIFQYLIDAGADINSVDRNGQTMLDKQTDADLQDFLILRGARRADQL